MSKPAIGPGTLGSSVIARRARAGLRLTAIAYLAVCSLGIADARADNAIDQITDTQASAEITCGSENGRSPQTDTTHKAGRQAADSAPITTSTAPTWKTITLGTHDSAKALVEALRAAGCRVGDLASEVVERPEFSVRKSRTEVDLVVVSVADLGFGEAGAPRAEIYKRAERLGLVLSPAEIAPQLRLQYADQPLGEFLHIAVEPMLTTGGDLVDLAVANGGAGLLLIAGDAHPNLVIPPSVRFVFVRHPAGRPPATAAAHR
jgi:hypothetical protein